MKNKRKVRLSLLIKIGVLIVLLFLAESIVFRIFLKDTFTDVNLTYQIGLAESIIKTAEDSIELNDFQEWQIEFWKNHKQAVLECLENNSSNEDGLTSMTYLYVERSETGTETEPDEQWDLKETLALINPDNRVKLAAYSLIALTDKMTVAGNQNCEVFFAEVNPGKGYTIFARNEGNDGPLYSVLGTKVAYPISETLEMETSRPASPDLTSRSADDNSASPNGLTDGIVSVTDEVEDGTSLFCYRLLPKTESGKQYMIGFRSDWTQLQEGIDEASNRSFYTILLMTGVVVILLLILLYLLMARRTSRIRKAVLSYEETKDASDVTERLSGLRKSSDEIGVLAGAFSDLTVEVDRYMTEQMELAAEKEQNKTQMKIAAKIQTDALPNVFPVFPDRNEFDIYASMDPAKSVGGDFYDMFFVDDDHLAVVIADVSDKGVPAALFMMTSKSLIKVRARMGGTPAEILTDVNSQLAENNKTRMFVTVLLAIVNVSDGKGLVANAGHEYPAVCRKDEDYTLVTGLKGFVLGAKKGMKYRDVEFQVNPGDCFFLYTDGVPEATNAEGEQFGMDRMVDTLNHYKEDSTEELLAHVRKDIDAFVGDAPQFDDLTMMSIRYRGPEKMQRG